MSDLMDLYSFTTVSGDEGEGGGLAAWLQLSSDLRMETWQQYHERYNACRYVHMHA
jgi:hypothetical protein